MIEFAFLHRVGNGGAEIGQAADRMFTFALLGVKMAQKHLFAEIERGTGGDKLRGNGGILAMRPGAREVCAVHLDNRFVERAYTLTKQPKARLTKTIVDNAQPADRRYHIQDAEIPGFSVKIEPSGSKIYVLDYRSGGGGRRAPKKRIKIGKHGVFTLEQARARAKEYLAKIVLGADPAEERDDERGKNLFKNVAARYLTEYIPLHNKPTTVKGKKHVMNGAILPHFRNMYIEDITRKDVQEWHGKLHKTPINANRSLATLSHMMSVCEDWGLREQNRNPCLGIKRYRENKRERYLNESELRRLIEVINQCEEDGSEERGMMIFFRLLIFTGARQGELLTAKWSYVNHEESTLDLPDSKTGKKKVNLCPEAMAEISKLEPLAGNPYIFPAYFIGVPEKLGRHHSPPNEMWHRILEKAEIKDFRKHDLRHAFASFAIMAGLTLEEIGQLLGHLTPQTTKRYSHLVDSHRKNLSNAVGSQISSILQTKDERVVNLSTRRNK